MRRDLRQTLHSAYSFIRSVETNKTASSITLEHLIQEHIDAISGQPADLPLLDGAGNVVGNRSSRIDRLERLQSDLQGVIAAIDSVKDDPDALEELGIEETDTNEGS